MYPDSLLQWLGYVAVVFGALALIGLFAWWLSYRLDRRHERRSDGKDDA